MPASALLTTDSIPESFKFQQGGISVHGLLASFLAFGGEEKEKFAVWKATWPSMQDFEESMPILWPKVLTKSVHSRAECTNDPESSQMPTDMLPPAINGRWTSERKSADVWSLRESSLLFKQKQKLETDWTIVSKQFPGKTKTEYVYYWLLVNTRSFYFDLVGDVVSEDHGDRMVMCPFIDYFNHNDHGVSLTRACPSVSRAEWQCDVAFDESSYTVTSDRAYGTSFWVES